MFDSAIFNLLYGNVLQEDILKEWIMKQDIRGGLTVPNFNFASHRCVYLHKYAAFHTTLVYDMMQLILNNQWQLFDKFMMSGNFKLCSLGGGPGSDAIGVLAALDTSFNNFKMNVTIVDIIENWKLIFASVVNELKYGNYGSLQTAAQESLEWNYIVANLLGSMSGPVSTAIGAADFVTMVKFVSASACQDTEEMIKKIFNVMKPGALVLYIDFAGGGFSHLVRRAASEVGLVTKFGPLRHYLYSSPHLQVERFGYASCCETRVTVHLLQKLSRNYNFQNKSPENLNAVQIHPSLSTLQYIHNVDNFRPESCYNNPSSSTQENVPSEGIMSSNFRSPSSRHNSTSSQNYNDNVSEKNCSKSNLSSSLNTQKGKNKSNCGCAQSNLTILDTSDTCCSCCVIS